MTSPSQGIVGNVNNIPPELRQLPFFVVRKGKLPYNPRTGKLARTNQPDTWCSFEEAVEAVSSGAYDGIGIVIPKDSGLAAIDLDTVRDPDTGWIDPIAREIIERCGSYTEVSMSGYGFHILGHYNFGSLQWTRRRLPENNIFRPDVDRTTGNTKRNQNGEIIYKRPEIEIYSQSQYIALTGDLYGLNRDLRDLSTLISELAQRFAEPNQLKIQTPTPTVPPSLEFPAALPPTQTTTPPIEQILKKARNAKNGDKFSKLMDGDLSEYNGDHSRADLALCSMAAYWTRADRNIMDAIFRISGLMRPKWDEQRGGKTYGELTIEEAIKNYRANPPHVSPSSLEATSTPTLALQKTGKLNNSGQSLLNQISALDPLHHISLINTELGGAQLFAHIFGAFCKFVSESRQWYIYDGKKWAPDDIRLMGQCQQLASAVHKYVMSLEIKNPDLQKAAHSAAKLWTKRNFRERVLRDAEVYCVASFSDFDRAEYLLNVQNGTINLKDFSFHDHSPDDRITKMAAVTYDPQAKSEIWESFLLQIFDGDEETIDYVQRIIGYSLLGSSPEECFFVFYGKTRAGKNTFLTPIQAMLGQDYVKIVAPETIAVKKFSNGSAPSEDLVRLSGMRLAIIDEPDKRLHINSGLIKRISGNNAITARGMYARSSVEIIPTFSLLIATNYLPNIDDPTIYNSNRLRLVHFAHQFSLNEQDHSLKERLCDPVILSAVFNWCLEGLSKYYTRGLVTPTKSQQMLQDLTLDCDLIATFFNNELVSDPEADIKLTSVYLQYKQWCEQLNYTPEPYNEFLHLVEAQYTVYRNKRPRNAGRNASPATILVGYRAKSCSGNDQYN